jgi:hypothetical protein
MSEENVIEETQEETQEDITNEESQVHETSYPGAGKK